MKIRRPDGYKVPCSDCIIHFYDDDIVVSEKITDSAFPVIPYEEWLDLPAYRAISFLTSYDDLPASVSLTAKGFIYTLRCWVRCPLCSTYWNVWDLRLIIREWETKDSQKTIKELLENKHIYMLSRGLKTEEYGVEYVWGSEEEILNERS